MVFEARPSPRLMRTMRMLLAPLMIAFGALASVRVSIPAETTGGPPTAIFSVERALRDVAVIAREPHPMGSVANHAVRDHLVGELTALGLAPEVQRVEVVPRRTPTVAATVENIVAVRKGRAPLGKALALMSHYDSVARAPGAADAGSGVAAILEALRATAGSVRAANDIVVVFTDGEERGSLGARAFVDRHPLAASIGLFVNFEARGTSGPVLLFQTSRGNAPLVQQFAAAAPAPIGDSLFALVYQYMPNTTDLSVTLAAGVAGLNLAFIEGRRHYHSSEDNARNLDAASLRHAGSYAVSLIERFGNTRLPPPAARDSGFFNLTGRSLITYPLWLADVLVVAALALSLWIFRRDGRGFTALVRASCGGAAFVLLAALATVAMVSIVGAFVLSAAASRQAHGLASALTVAYACLAVAVCVAVASWIQRGVGWKSSTAATLGAGVATIAIGAPPFVTAVTAAVISASLLLLRGRPDLRTLAPGVLLAWVASSAVVALRWPAAMHLLLVPCLFILLAEVAGGAVLRDEARRTIVVAVVSVAGCVWWLAYYVRSFYVAVGTEMPGVTFALVALVVVLALPLMQAERSPWLSLELATDAPPFSC